MRELHLIFETAKGEEQIMVIHQPSEGLTPKQIMEKMKEICECEVFQRAHQPYFVGIRGAKYVERIEEILFMIIGKDLEL